MNLDKYKDLFLEEAREHVDALARELTAEAPLDRAALDSLFRHAHSVKGMAAAMALDEVRDIAHALEDSLGACREGKSELDATLAGALIAAVDSLSAEIESFANDTPKLEPAPEIELVPEADPTPDPTPTEPIHRERTIRVEARFANSLQDRVTDLVLRSGEIAETFGHIEDRAARKSLTSLRRSVRELKESTTTFRLVRFASIEDELQRTVRTTASRLKKRVNLTIQGGDLSLDRSVVDGLLDPLVHILRNAIDHGIESTVERSKLEKDPAGAITIDVRRFDDAIQVSVADDGRGFDRERLLRAAEEQDAMPATSTDDDVLMLATLPGLSTADAVTDVSGRGVGLDAVRAQIEALGGRMQITSESGVGTTISLRAPLTLALQRLYLVMSGGQPYALPRRHLARIVRCDETGRNDSLGEQPAISVSLSEALDMAPNPDARIGLVLQIGNENILIRVDEVVACRELVVRPLGRPLQRLAAFSAAALLPDGRIALVLDPEGLRTRLDKPLPLAMQ